MLGTILQKAVQSGVFDLHVSLEHLLKNLGDNNPVIRGSLTRVGDGIFMLVERENKPFLAVLSPHERTLSGFSGESLTEHEGDVTYHAVLCPLDHGNAVQLRKSLPCTGPSVLSCRKSFGTGDRIGYPTPATPAHIRACERYNITPVLAQQSVRENQKTGRSFEQVMDDVTWSVFRCGFLLPWGADADHLKTLDDISEAVNAGFAMFTLDPSDLIDNGADTDSDNTLRRKLDLLFTDREKADSFISRYEGWDGCDERTVVRSCVKYISVTRHAVKAYGYLVDRLGDSGFNFEMSIDETSTPTTVLDHRIIVKELNRKGVRLFSLAPRFEGDFEKGIDYRGSIECFSTSLANHVALAKELGDYRLSLHSGSDKFSIYPVFGRITDGFFHVKTAGTSYLEALKVIIHADMELFRKILALSVETFHENASSYHISANVNRVPDAEKLSREKAENLIASDPDMRQILHIAYGVVLHRLGDELKAGLYNNRELYHNFLMIHIEKHLSLLTGS
ncbi:tagaturonate epimerase family protein [Candidatus Latescibacterota bacterium]